MSHRRPDGAPLPVTVLSGFLGAGKTTVLRRLLREQRAHRCAVIVNDLSELPVDAELVREAREGGSEVIIDLHGGSLGGALRGAFREALGQVAADPEITYLVIETSGGTHPAAMIAELEAHPGVTLDAFVSVVDGLNLLRDHAGGQALLDDDETDLNSTRALLRAQIRVATLLLVAKADLLQRPQAEAMLRRLRQLNASAAIRTITYGKVDPKHLLDTGAWERLRGSRKHTAGAAAPAPPADEPAHFDLGATVVRDPRPLHPRRLHTLIAEALPMGVHRSKGWLWLPSRPLDVLVWHQSGSHVQLEWAATWKAGILVDPDAKLLPEERRGIEEQVRALHPLFGDRHCELTVIGHSRDREAFAEQLAGCVCTEEEVDAWQRGEPFDDPWPRSLRRV